MVAVVTSRLTASVRASAPASAWPVSRACRISWVRAFSGGVRVVDERLGGEGLVGHGQARVGAVEKTKEAALLVGRLRGQRQCLDGRAGTRFPAGNGESVAHACGEAVGQVLEAEEESFFSVWK
jgi:hypothetical protein